MRKIIVARAAPAGLVLAVILGSGGYALASIVGPPTSNTINGCVANSSHVLTVPGKACPGNTTPLSWNITGPTGKTGPQGPRGPQGQAGLNGQNGVSVESQQLASGNSNCPNGGAEFTAFDGSTFACNGAAGTPGAQGPPGPSFASSFSLTFNGTTENCSVTSTDGSGNITGISCSGDGD
jgi:hypothetical protein